MPFVAAFGLSVLLTPLAGRLGLALRLVDAPRHGVLKIHRRPIPVLGGLAVVAATFGSVGLIGLPPSIAVLAAVLLALGIGLVDDSVKLPAGSRLVLLAGVGAVLVAGGLKVEALGSVGGVGVVALVLACANAVNMIDGQDGLAGGLGAIAAVGLAFVAGDRGAEDVGLALGGSLAGFLVWNRPPARIFLGNGGAYALGTLLAVVAVAGSVRGFRGIIAAGLCLGVFAFELTYTVARRIGGRRSLIEGDREHSYDILADRAGRGRATLVLCALGAALSGVAVLSRPLPLPVLAVMSLLLVVAALWWGRHLHREAIRQRP